MAIFDGDDTLWATERLYDDARSAAAGAVDAAGLDPIEWEVVERKIDVESVRLRGYQIDRFPTSCVQAYLELCRRERQPCSRSVVEQIRRAADSVFDRDALVFEDVRCTLEHLRANGVRLALLTKGDRHVQSKRIASSGLSDYFDVVEIVDAKSPRVIEMVAYNLGGEVSSSWMIGNSIRSDIAPALRTGMRAIWIDSPTWEYERTTLRLNEGEMLASDLAAVGDLISL